MIIGLTIIFIFIIIFYHWKNFIKFCRKKKVIKSNNLTTFNKKNLNNWMNLTKKERYNLSKRDSITYLDKRRILLAEIRKEYKNISQVNSKKSINQK